MKIKFSHIINLSALLLATVVGYFSIIGFTKLFSAAYWPIIIMTSSLELAKLVSASFLYRYWDSTKSLLKVYLVISVIILMLITSTGVYGFLSSAYSTTSNQLSKVDGKIEQLEKRKGLFEGEIKRVENNIKIKNDRINTLNSLRVSQESRLDTLYKKGLSVKNAQKTITDANIELENSNKNISELSEIINNKSDSISKIELSILDLKNSDIKGEIGPLKYISKLTGKDIDVVVNFFILLLIFVCDPLAICLVIAANKTLLDSNNKQASNKEIDWVNKWKEDGGDNTLRLKYNLNEKSIVIDYGDSEEEWVNNIIELYKCKVIVIEDSNKNYLFSKYKYKDNKNVKVILKKGKNILKELESLGNIDLIKINIKGDEYKFLNSVLDEDFNKKIANYQIQFDNNKTDSISKYEKIKDRFNRNNYTHTYCYPFVWENFKNNN